MAFREVRVFEVREVLRLWLAGEGIRATERLVGFDRKTVRRYVDAAVELGLVRDGGDDQLSDVLIGLVVEAVRPHRIDGHGAAWRLLQTHHDDEHTSQGDRPPSSRCRSWTRCRRSHRADNAHPVTRGCGPPAASDRCCY